MPWKKVVIYPYVNHPKCQSNNTINIACGEADVATVNHLSLLLREIVKMGRKSPN